MRGFYSELDRIADKNRNARICASRPENLHDYQGCANDPNMVFTPPVVADGPAEGIATETFRSDRELLQDILFYARTRLPHHEKFTAALSEASMKINGFRPVEPAAPAVQPEMQIVADKSPLSKRPFVKTRGSGWFWCHRPMVGGSSDWSVLYINALWGALIDGKYVRTDNFDDVVGPLEAPREN